MHLATQDAHLLNFIYKLLFGLQIVNFEMFFFFKERLLRDHMRQHVNKYKVRMTRHKKYFFHKL